MFDCPKCLGKLEEKTTENIKVDVCWVCEGMWFDKGELDKVLASDSKNFKLIDLGSKEFDGKEMSEMAGELDKKLGKCPHCSEQMIKKPYEENKSVNVDVCPKECGIWLDGGEIHSLRNRTEVNRRAKIKESKDARDLMFDGIFYKIFGSKKQQ